ncbi:MAG: hypothetical protein Q7J54_07810 [Candidatus Woesearchaeota archaeon]|nr:hypothetical protein [Candidatus Woesearchaeota archaeon]
MIKEKIVDIKKLAEFLKLNLSKRDYPEFARHFKKLKKRRG